jgi:hypothetical protein
MHFVCLRSMWNACFVGCFGLFFDNAGMLIAHSLSCVSGLCWRQGTLGFAFDSLTIREEGLLANQSYSSPVKRGHSDGGSEMGCGYGWVHLKPGKFVAERVDSSPPL